MPFVPRAVGHTVLKFPKDKWRIALLSQSAKEAWYVAQDPDALVWSTKEFQEFWKTWYMGHLKLKRFAFRFKFW